MIRIQYRFKTKEPLHTGSNEKLGILRTLRKQTVIIDDNREIKSRFRKDQQKLRRQAVALLLYRLWDKIPDRQRVTIYEEIAAKLLASTSAPNKEEFLQVLCRRLEIRESTTDQNRRFDIIDILELFDDEELLTLIRKESQYIMQVFRRIKNENIAWQKEVGGKSKISKNTLFGTTTLEKSPEVLIQDALEEVMSQDFQVYELGKREEQIPTIAGNSIRGLIRRLVMRDYFDFLGLTKLLPKDYHMMMTGGTITDDTGLADISKKRELFDMCPMLFLLGTAAGNQTLQGCLKVCQADLVCKENGFDDLGYRSFVEVLFGTRLDTSKLENVMDFEEKDDQTHQMLYEYEVFVKGAEFAHEFVLDLENHPLSKPTFYAMLKIFMDFGFIAAKGSIGHGEIDIKDNLTNAILTVEPEFDKYVAKYYEHLESNKQVIKNFWLKNFKNKPEIKGDISKFLSDE